MKKSFTLLTILFIFLGSCKKDLLDPECDGSKPTYDGEVKSIIDANCTNSSCHGSGSKHDDYTTYDGLSEVIANGEFEEHVLNKQNMPRGGDLSQNEINLIQCWVDNNYPEN